MIGTVPTATLVPYARRIAVLRAGGIGDLVFALPALASLRAAYPHAEIVLLCAASQVGLLETDGTLIDEVAIVPPAAIAFLDGRIPVDTPELDDLVSSLRSHGLFDLAIQLHGGGARSNVLVARLGARVTVGLRAPGAPPLDRSVPYVYYQPEVVRDLEVVALAGAAPVAFAPALEVSDAGRREASDALRRVSKPFVVVHPMAGDPRRRWTLASYASVLADLVGDGLEVVIVGGPADRSATARLAADVAQAVDSSVLPHVHDLGGAVSLGGLMGVLERATLVFGNDSGPLHVAAAVGAPTVGIYWFGNVINAAPFTRSRHRLAISWRRDCPVCGADCLVAACAHDASFVDDVSPDEVLALARELLLERRGFEMAVKQPSAPDGRDSADPTRTLA